MSRELEIHMVPRDLYYHEIAYVRGLEAEIERLRTALQGALSMVEAFASGSGFSHSGRVEYENYRAALEPKP